MSDKYSKDGNSSLDAKLFELMLKEAAERYYEENEENPPEYNPGLIPSEDMKYFADRKDIIYKKILRQAKTGGRKTKHTARKYILIAAVIGIIAALTVSASAVKEYLREVTVSISGNTLSVNSKRVASESYDGIKDFKRMDEVIVPQKLPDCILLDEVEADEAMIKLKYRDADEGNQGRNFLYYDIVYLPDTARGGGLALENNEYVIEDISIMGMDGVYIEVVNQLGRIYRYVEWCSDNVSYTIQTSLTEEELKLFIDNLTYLSSLK